MTITHTSVFKVYHDLPLLDYRVVKAFLVCFIVWLKIKSKHTYIYVQIIVALIKFDDMNVDNVGKQASTAN